MNYALICDISLIKTHIIKGPHGLDISTCTLLILIHIYSTSIDSLLDNYSGTRLKLVSDLLFDLVYSVLFAASYIYFVVLCVCLFW